MIIWIPPYLTKISDIRRYKQRQESILDYYFRHYSYFQGERAKHFNKIKECLLQNSKSYSFENWHRIIDLRFIQKALSSEGSLLNDPGGRFNIGSIDELKFAKFPALYIAEDYQTAFKEKYQVFPNTNQQKGLSAEELSLTNKVSTADLLVEGNIEVLIDLTESKVLREFYNIIKDIKITKKLETDANKLNIPVMYHVKDYDELKKSILGNEWREMPMQVDIPANSQIFGQLAHESGIEAVLYPSKMSKSKKCLAIFPRNFNNSDSYVRIKDEDIPDAIEHGELNSKTYLYL